jgi:acetoin utilization deacetylase AcuC-like enzyme
VLHALDDAHFAATTRAAPPPATRAQLERVHTPEYIEQVFAAAPRHGTVQLDADTLMSAGSLEAALHAAGAACAATDAVLHGDTLRAFCAVRPPGHHATHNRAMGFCLFNNIAVAAAHALATQGIQKIAVADFDVHHGNGSEDIFVHEPRVLYASSHQSPLYPGTGTSDGGPQDNIVNAPLPPGTGSDAFRAAWETALLPAIDRFRPQLLLISAGFDAHARDPLADLRLTTDDYRWITERLCALADRHAQGRVVSVLEGGYDLAALAECATTHVKALMA